MGKGSLLAFEELEEEEDVGVPGRAKYNPAAREELLHVESVVRRFVDWDLEALVRRLESGHETEPVRSTLTSILAAEEKMQDEHDGGQDHLKSEEHEPASSAIFSAH